MMNGVRRNEILRSVGNGKRKRVGKEVKNHFMRSSRTTKVTTEICSRNSNMPKCSITTDMSGPLRYD